MITLLKKTINLVYNKLSPRARLLSHQVENIIHLILGNDKPIIYCLGDSHNDIFSYIKRTELFSEASLRCVTVQGATIFGLANPNSKSNALPIFERELRHAPSGFKLSLLLGEIDCGFLIWLRSKTNETSVENELDECLQRYKNFLIWASSLPSSGICVISVPPQTIFDDCKGGEIANIRHSVMPPYYARQQLTDLYNIRLEGIARELGLTFLDMNPLLLEHDTNKVKSIYLNKDPLNHHLNHETAGPLYAQQLRSWLIHQ